MDYANLVQVSIDPLYPSTGLDEFGNDCQKFNNTPARRVCHRCNRKTKTGWTVWLTFTDSIMEYNDVTDSIDFCPRCVITEWYD